MKRNHIPGPLISLLLHGSFVLVAMLSITAPGIGRGGGRVGEPGREGPESSRSFQAEIREPQSPGLVYAAKDERAFAPIAEDEAAVEADAPVTAFDPLTQTSDAAGQKVPLPAPSPASRQRSSAAFARIPSAGGENPRPTTETPGDSKVQGTGGDTGFAGEGTVLGLYTPSPEYPRVARRKGHEGVALIEIEIQADGSCKPTRIVEASGYDELDQAALTTVKTWRYPARTPGSLLTTRVRFVFRLQN